MSANVADAQLYPKRTTERDSIEFKAKAVIGASGAVSSQVVSDSGVSIAKNATTGQYDLTFPASPGDVYIYVQFYSPAGTVSDFYIKALTESSGTASIICLTPAGAASYPASSDRIYVKIDADGRS